MSKKVSNPYARIITHMRHLCLLDYGDDIEENVEHLNCPGCHATYSKDPWEFGKTVDYPVRLPCYHFYGLKCLAQVAVSEEDAKERSLQCPECDDFHPLLPWEYDTAVSDSVAHYNWAKSDTPVWETEAHYNWAKSDMAIHNAIPVAAFSRNSDGFVDWTKLFMQMYETSYIFDVENRSPRIIDPEQNFSRPLLLLEVALRSMGFFNGDCNLPDVPQLRQDLNDLRNKVDSDRSLLGKQEEDLPQEGYPGQLEAILSRADFRLITFVDAVKELRAKDGKTKRMKYLQEHLCQDISWLLWQKTKDCTIMLSAFSAGI